ncbi:uncharacterized protein LOC111445407 isoform X2 [Cucurbita moschata]|uniref:Uncharacterized protein LOC111445407 isoform X2 n=1 Tax=Cucurbita moschata TaxID=3662 RepID=A0A6J1FG57_CUCMO|nr:uncharacterized protein LOC111445407 isoform X2 [Cucurbita moschata]
MIYAQWTFDLHFPLPNDFESTGLFRIGWITDSFEHFSARIVVRFGGMFRIIQAFDMIDFACGVIRISNKCYCREIFDQREPASRNKEMATAAAQERPRFCEVHLNDRTKAMKAKPHASQGIQLKF